MARFPRSLQVLHKCDEPRCCNPDHLFLGTASENKADTRRKGRGRNEHTTTPKTPRPWVLASTRRRTGSAANTRHRSQRETGRHHRQTSGASGNCHHRAN